MTKLRRAAEAGRWMQPARYDLKAARWNSEGGFHDTACFLSQQAAEKALKSLLYYGGASRRKLLTHSTLELLTEAVKVAQGLEEHSEKARELDLHYVPSRYPNGLPGGYPHRFYSRETAEKAIAAAEAITRLVEDYYEGQKFPIEDD